MSNPVNGLWRAGKAGYYDNRANWKNDRYEELLEQIGAEFTAEDRFDMIKEAALIIQKETPVVTTYMSLGGVAWWPWVKNYYGEVTVDDYVQFSAFMATAWIDQAVKKEMGF
jgi:peptide/nickel transport system substrate-binding protein